VKYAWRMAKIALNVRSGNADGLAAKTNKAMKSAGNQARKAKNRVDKKINKKIASGKGKVKSIRAGHRPGAGAR
ncbi:MAG: hypothetical protein AAFS10_22160, partial [Myxococcota bacterium]